MDVSVILSASGIKCNAVGIGDYKTQLKISYIFSYLSTLCLFLGEYDDKRLFYWAIFYNAFLGSNFLTKMDINTR